MGQVFSSQEIQSWAQQAGTTPDKMKQVLAEAVPHVVDHATPNGNIPDQTPNLSRLIGNLLSKYA